MSTDQTASDTTLGAHASMGTIAAAKRELYRTQVVSAAEIEFSKTGFADTKMNTIAATAGLSLATVYKTFSGKQEIWDHLHTARMNSLLASIEGASADSESILERIVVGVAATARFLTEHPAYLEMSIRAGTGWATGAGESGVQATVWGAGLVMITEGIEAGVRSGEIRSIRPTIAAGLVVSALQLWLTEWVDSGRDRPAADVIDELAANLRLILTGRL